MRSLTIGILVMLFCPIPATLSCGENTTAETIPNSDAKPPVNDKVPVDSPPDPALVQLETIGALAAINAQQSFLVIGVVSDSHFKGVYEPRQVRSLMNGVIRQLEMLSTMLRKLQTAKLAEEDNEYVEQVLALHAKLQTQARALLRFTEKRGEAEARAFEKARQSALSDLERLLGGDSDSPADAPTDQKPAERPSPVELPEQKPDEN